MNCTWASCVYICTSGRNNSSWLRNVCSIFKYVLYFSLHAPAMGHLLKWENKRLNSKSQLSRSHNDTYSVVEKCIGWFFCFVCFRFHLRFKNRLPIWNVFLIIKIESNIKYSVLKAEAWRVWYILTINSVAVSLKLVCKKMRRLKYPSQSWRIRKKKRKRKQMKARAWITVINRTNARGNN